MVGIDYPHMELVLKDRLRDSDRKYVSQETRLMGRCYVWIEGLQAFAS